MEPVRDDPGATRQVPVTGTGNLYVQAGSFQNLQNAEAVRQQLAGLGPVEIQTTMVDGTPFYRVRVGPLSDVAAADTSLQGVMQRGHNGARIVVD